jgi:leucyl/phenylalanyl-tRNA--protein transferase
MNGLAWLDPDDDNQGFPNPDLALREPDGLLAVGGNLSPKRLLEAYRRGIFPWYSAGQPILWWSPDPRTVLFPGCIKISRSLRKAIRKGGFSITMDTAFATVIRGCGEPRGGDEGTWITPEINDAYCRLHALGYAHSVEIWQHGRLVGGLYGVAIGRVFYGESMFSRVSDASKITLVALAQQLQRWAFGVIDCQLHTAHLMSLGAEDIRRPTFIRLLDRYCPKEGYNGLWHIDEDLPGFPER